MNPNDQPSKRLKFMNQKELKKKEVVEPKIIQIIDPFPINYLEQHYRQNITQQAKLKIQKLLSILSKPVIDVKSLRNVCFLGIPDECKGLRSLCWKILVGYLPAEKAQWKSVVEQNNETYLYLCQQFFIDSIDAPPKEKEDELKRQFDKSQVNIKKSKKKGEKIQYPDLECYNWKQFFEDSNLYEDVEKDTTRTRSEMHFFVTDTSEEYAILNQKQWEKQDQDAKKQKAKSEDLLQMYDDKGQEEEQKKNEDQQKFSQSQQLDKSNQNSNQQNDDDLLNLYDDVKSNKEEQTDLNKENQNNNDNDINKNEQNKDPNTPKKLEGQEDKTPENNKQRSNSKFQQIDKQVNMDNQRYKVLFKTYIQDERKVKNDMSEKHYDVLSRILYTYAKTNPGIKYVQGMNEILAPLYYVFRNDKTSDFFSHTVESDAFFCFTNLMGDGLKDSFIQNLDDSDTGIRTKVTELNQLLKEQDLELWTHLTEMGINPLFYALRWIMLVLTQEFEMYDVLRLWDSFLAHTDRMMFIFHLCLAVLNLMRPALLTDEFASIMETLQSVGTLDILDIINTAQQLYKEKKARDLKKKVERENQNSSNDGKLSGLFSNIMKGVNKVSDKIIKK